MHCSVCSRSRGASAEPLVAQAAKHLSPRVMSKDHVSHPHPPFKVGDDVEVLCRCDGSVHPALESRRVNHSRVLSRRTLQATTGLHLPIPGVSAVRHDERHLSKPSDTRDSSKAPRQYSEALDSTGSKAVAYPCESRPPHANAKARTLAILVVGSLLPTVGPWSTWLCHRVRTHFWLRSPRNPTRLQRFWAAGCVMSLTIVLGQRQATLSSTRLEEDAHGQRCWNAGTLFYSFYVYSFSSLPPAPNAPKVGEQAPDFAVVDPEGRNWALSEFRGDVLVFFYRGHW